MLGKVVALNQRDWDIHLPIVMAAYRASPHSSTEFTPNQLFLARETRMPIDLVLEDALVQSEVRTLHDYVCSRGQHIQRAFILARGHMKRQAVSRRARYDLRVKASKFRVGQFVWYFYPRRRPALKEKWTKFFVGPFRVMEQIGPVLYKIQKFPRAQNLIIVSKEETSNLIIRVGTYDRSF